MSPPEVPTQDRPSHTPGPVSLQPSSPSDSPSPPPPPWMVFTVQLAALAVVFRGAPRVIEACLEPIPPPLAWKILAGMAGVVAIIAAPTPSLRAVLRVVTRSREK